MGFEIILDNVQDILNGNFEYRKAKYKQEGNIFTIYFYDDDTMEFPSDGFSEYIGFILKVGNYIHIQDKDKNILIIIREVNKQEQKKIYNKIQDEFYLIASLKKSKKSKKSKSKKRKSKKRKSKRIKSKKK